MSSGAHPHGHRVRVAIALTTACLFVACGLLAMNHAADVAHVRDHTGAATHGLETGCDESAPTTHLHSVPDRHDGECALTDILHQSVRTLPAISTAISCPAIVLSDVPPTGIELVQRGLLLAAPKTSPPLA